MSAVTIMQPIFVVDVTQNFDCVFWCGDLNFRLLQPRDEVVQWVAEQRFPVPQPLTLQNDQLRNSRIEGRQEQVIVQYFVAV
jgi:hypothetical protein